MVVWICVCVCFEVVGWLVGLIGWLTSRRSIVAWVHRSGWGTTQKRTDGARRAVAAVGEPAGEARGVDALRQPVHTLDYLFVFVYVHVCVYVRFV